MSPAAIRWSGQMLHPVRPCPADRVAFHATSCQLPCFHTTRRYKPASRNPKDRWKLLLASLGLGDAGEGLPVAALGESTQQLTKKFASCACAVMVDIDIDTGFRRPSEGGEALQWLPAGEADDLIITFEDEPFVGATEPIDARSHLVNGRGRRFPN
jgi:hypothetical protein